MTYQVMPDLTPEGTAVGFTALNGRLNIIPSIRGRFYISLIEEGCTTELYSRNDVEWDSVIYFMEENGIDRRHLTPTYMVPVSDCCEVRRRRKAIAKTNLYVIQAVNGGPIKIGIADSINERVKQLQTGNPYELNVVDFIDNVSPSLEARLHKKYKDYRLHGEWFEDCVLPHVMRDLSNIRAERRGGNNG